MRGAHICRAFPLMGWWESLWRRNLSAIDPQSAFPPMASARSSDSHSHLFPAPQPSKKHNKHIFRHSDEDDLRQEYHQLPGVAWNNYQRYTARTQSGYPKAVIRSFGRGLHMNQARRLGRHRTLWYSDGICAPQNVSKNRTKNKRAPQELT